jgi:hypothetical protein
MHRASCPNLCTVIAACCGLSACGDGDENERSCDCSVFPVAQSSEYILPWHVGHAYTARPHAARESGPQQYAFRCRSVPTFWRSVLER